MSIKGGDADEVLRVLGTQEVTNKWHSALGGTPVSVFFSFLLCHALLPEASLTTFSLAALTSAPFPRPELENAGVHKNCLGCFLKMQIPGAPDSQGWSGNPCLK